MTIDTDDETADRDHVAELIEAAERATPEDDSLDFRRLTRAAQASGRAVLDLEALANSEAVQDIINLRLAQERQRAAEKLRRAVLWLIAATVVNLAAGAGLAAALFLL